MTEPLTLFLSNILNSNTLPTLIALITTTLIAYRSLPLVRAEGPEDQSRAQKILVGCIIAGVLMSVAKPVTYWVTGWNVTTMQQGLPVELIASVDKLLQLLMYIGVIVVIAGLIYGGIQLSRTTPKNNNPNHYPNKTKTKC
ncbi:MAG: hypothetical protein FWC33_02200 [Candidatus Bathyarchaeota archaeon]|nr:hypothetical protein [Candidatus Termiticorpusculum sp.]